MSDELRATITNLTTDIRQTVADACAAMNHAAAQLKAADTPTSPEHIASILERLDALERRLDVLERRVADIIAPEINYETLSNRIDLSDLAEKIDLPNLSSHLADHLDYGEIVANIDTSEIASDVAENVDFEDEMETVVRNMLRSI
jgi:hypothetical protein